MISVIDGSRMFHFFEVSGKATIGLRLHESDTVLIIAEDLQPRAALDLVANIIKEKTSQVDLAGLTIRIVDLPLWKGEHGDERQEAASHSPLHY